MREPIFAMRMNKEDRKQLEGLRSTLGVPRAAVVRLALSRLEQEVRAGRIDKTHKAVLTALLR
jgi:hypothetical protein